MLLTGSTGFVGSRLCERMISDGGLVRRALRRAGAHDGVVVGDLGPETKWSEALTGVDGVIHLAARVHVMKDIVSEPLAEFRKVNTQGTLNLAQQAAASGVRRFVYLSTIKVNGEDTIPAKPFKTDDDNVPVTRMVYRSMRPSRGCWRLLETLTWRW